MKSLLILFVAIITMQFVVSCGKTQSKESQNDSTDTTINADTTHIPCCCDSTAK